MSGRTPVPGSALNRHLHCATTDHAQSSSGERAGAIAGALVGSPTCFAYVQHPIILTLNKLALQCVSFAIEFGLLDAVNLDTIMHV